MDCHLDKRLDIKNTVFGQVLSENSKKNIFIVRVMPLALVVGDTIKNIQLMEDTMEIKYKYRTLFRVSRKNSNSAEDTRISGV